MSLSSKTILVTGATAGIGQAIARELAGRGARLLLTGRNAGAGRALEAELAGSGGKARFVQADVTDPGAAKLLTEAAVATFGRLDVLVNNAGIVIRGDALHCTDEDWERIMATNVTALFRLSREVLPVMQRQGGGAIVNIASDWGLVGAVGAVAYGASKGAVVQITRSMAIDHARDGIRVNAVCPGDTDTTMLDGAMEGPDRAAELARMGQALPLGRVGQPAEIAKVVAFLASDDASFITGACLPVDGGNTAQ
ncbi:MAG TPA: glucose 1-dehydrogenase [Geminicoccus sp.]|uniref:SDR family NAD(P)-dependent oxidoreductase n=1 Tax=Geminicoccus sp. TaxID=2024832 RepID=UPI002D18DDAB|nr:glucose 1-dehydrogenase [Geminicoccus sp.]HWL71144.1 glucose 1-dehydrogenase [Geminicoccus sp.]